MKYLKLFVVATLLKFVVLKLTDSSDIYLNNGNDFNDDIYKNLKSDLNNSSIKMLMLSDLHLDLFYDEAVSVADHCRTKNIPKEKPITPQANLLVTEDKINNNFLSNINSNNLIIDPIPNQTNNIEFLNTSADYGKYRCDTNKILFDLVLSKANELSNYDYVIILGDNINHWLNLSAPQDLESNYRNHFKYISDALKSFGKAKILWVIGNNDFHQRYNLPPKDDYNRQVEVMREFLGNPFAGSEVKGTTDDGYLKTWYTYNLTDSIKGVFFNSVLFSVFQADSADRARLIELQFEFIEAELKEAEASFVTDGKNSYKLMFFYHIPNTMSFYDNKKHLNWKVDYSERFDKLMFNYKDYVLMNFNGHYHLGGLGVRKQDEMLYSQMVNVPGVSPSNNSGTGFAVVELVLYNSESGNIKSANGKMVNYYINIEQPNNIIQFDLSEKLGLDFTFSISNKPNTNSNSLANSILSTLNLSDENLYHLYSGKPLLSITETFTDLKLTSKDDQKQKNCSATQISEAEPCILSTLSSKFITLISSNSITKILLISFLTLLIIN